MDLEHQGRDRSGRRYSLSRCALFAAPSLIVTALLINVLPNAAQSQINGRVIAAPQVSATHPAATPKLPQAPVQVALPPSPPTKFMPGLEEPLLATGPVSEQEGRELDAALKSLHEAPLNAPAGSDFSDYAKGLLAFVAAHPQSNWNAAIYTDLGFGYYRAGYYSKAFTSLERAWDLGRNADNPQLRLMVDRAVGELARMHARVGHDKELEALLKDIGKRPIGGPATETIQGAREGLWAFHHDPGEAYLCGPAALRNVLTVLKAKPEQLKVAEDARSGPHGFSLPQLAALADQAKLKYTLIHRAPGQPMPVPSVVNWNVHHYAAITGTQGALYTVQDPTFGGSGGNALTGKAIDAESSGYFLVPASVMKANPKAHWRVVAANSAEAKAVYGMGTANASNSDETNCFSCLMKRIFGVDQNPGMPDLTPTNMGMPVVNAHPMVVSLNLTDTPVGYKPQKGRPAYVTLSYNQREAFQPATFSYGNVGPKWTLNVTKFVADTPASSSSLPLSLTTGGGGAYTQPNAITPSGQYYGEFWYSSIMSRIPISGGVPTFKRVRPDGGVENYTLSNGATTAPRYTFLTSATDPAGNTTTYHYDSTFRLTSITDAMGRNTTFTYGLSAQPLLITQITDPFGRTTQITYDTSLRLSTITDALGITTSFTYSTAEPTFIQSMTTPYGTSTFCDTPDTSDPVGTDTRSLTMTDPMGFTDYMYFYQNSSIVPATDPAAIVPTGMMTDGNALLEWRNTFYWDKHAFALGATINSSGVPTSHDYSKALILHWIHEGSINPPGAFWAGRVLESIKKPLERRVWYNFPFPTSNRSYFSGTLGTPTVTGRVLDDGTTQLSKASYNTTNTPPPQTGTLASTTDPKGRSTKYTYAANQLDLLTIQQLTTAPSTYTTIATYGSYNTLHEPQTYTDAAGQVWHMTYNAAGQITSITDPATGLTTWNYDSMGRIANVVNANTATALTYTYDSADRVATKTDSEGYMLTYGYDNLDRVTSITYPDGTTDLYDYKFQSGPNVGTQSLELRKHTDRLGRVTTYGYDADRRLTSVTEPTTATTTRTTSYDYYENGTLKNITDATGNVTHWDIDSESRPVKKTYAFGTSSAQTEIYAYEAASGRLHSITDALGQVKTFTYGIDDRVTAIAYTGVVNPTPNISFTWDNFFPRITSMTDGLGTTNFAYTAIGSNGALKLASIDGPFASDVIGLTYDALGRLAGRNITGGNETFAYDAISRLITHASPLGTHAYTYLGQTSQTATRALTGTSISTAWGYDTNANDRRLISIANSGVTRTYAFSYLDPATSANNPYDIMGITDTAAAGHPFATQTHGYAYDSVDRLLTATSTTPGNYSYGYDNLDNATSITDPGLGSISPTYNGFNQLATFPTRTYTYDNNGNTTSDGLLRNYKWDAENRLIEVDYIGTSNKTTFAYDGLGRRTVAVETVGGTSTTTRFLWCEDRICQTRDGSDVVQSRILPEGEYNVVSTQKAIYMPDQLGSVRDVLDATTGNLISSIDYSPYGNPIATSGTFSPLYQYAGLAFHPQSGLMISATRFYDPIAPHWLSRDWIKERGGWNLYAYGAANPTNLTDQNGFWPHIWTPFGPVDFRPDLKSKAQKELPGVLQTIVPTLTKGEACQLSNDIIDELGMTDKTLAESFDGLSNINQLSAPQRAAIGKFLDRLPSSDLPAINKVKKVLGL
jgi:RHS repeat-associated protein